MFLFFPIPALTRTVLISLIALLTLLGIMLRPWKVSEAIIALTGAGALLLLGLLSPVEALPPCCVIGAPFSSFSG